MPRIPKIERQTSGQTNFGIGDQSESVLAVERRQAQGLQTLGQGMSQLASGLEQYNRHKNAMNDKLLQKTSIVNAQEAAQAVFDDVLMDKSLSPDQMVKEADARYNEIKKRALEELPREKAQEMDLIWRETMLKRRETLMAEQRTRELDVIKRNSDIVKDSVKTFAEMNYSAEDLAEGVGNVVELYENQKENLMINEEERIELTRMATREVAVSAIQGMIRDNKHEQALERMGKGDLGSYFTPDEREKMFGYIKQKGREAENHLIQQMNFEENKRKMFQSRQKEKTFSSLTQMINQNADGIQVKQAMSSALESGQLTTANYNFLQKLQEGSTGDSDDILSFKYTHDIVQAEKPTEQIVSEIVSDVNSSKMGAKTGEKLILRVRSIKNEAMKTNEKMYNEQFKLGKEVFDDFFGSREFLENIQNAGPMRKSLKTQALNTYIEETIKNPEAPKVALARSIIKNMGAGEIILQSGERQIKGVPNNATEEQIVERIKLETLNRKQKKDGAMSDEDYNEFVLRLRDRLRFMEAKRRIEEEVGARGE